MNCKCHGFGFFFGSEIRGWRRRPSDRLTCRDCGKPSAWQRLLYWWYGYRSNDDVIESPASYVLANPQFNGGQECDAERDYERPTFDDDVI